MTDSQACTRAVGVINYSQVMKALILTALAAILSQGGVTPFDLAYPAKAYQGGTVVAALELKRGSVDRVSVLSGEEPFVEPTRTALLRWRFPKEREDRPALVIVNFRGPTLYAVGSAERKLKLVQKPDLLPQPDSIVEPSYPTNSLGQGSVTLQLQVDPKGRISKIEVIKGLGGLTAACRDSVQKWRLAPARDESGTAVASDAFAVCVFRQPVL